MSRAPRCTLCFVLFVATAVARGQIPSSSDLPDPVSALPGEPLPEPLWFGAKKIVMVQENDGSSQKCRLIRSWIAPAGTRVYQVQSLQTQEMLTIVEKQPSSDLEGRPASMQIYHWGQNNSPPPGAPMPPSSGIRQVSQTGFEDSPTPPVTGESPLGSSRLSVPAPATPVQLPVIPLVQVEWKSVGTVCTAQTACPRGAGSCRLLHYFEKPPVLDFKPGRCFPVCSPCQMPSFGYYPTRWRPWPEPVISVRPTSVEPPPEAMPFPAITHSKKH
jgi:hypothetical protein